MVWTSGTTIDLCKKFIRKNQAIQDIFYFTALTHWNQARVKRHQEYIRALQTENIRIIHGEFKTRDKVCKLCRGKYISHEEKQTDVNIAIKLFEEGLKGSFETRIIISGDSDLIPAIEAIKRTLPNLTIGVLVPYARPAKGLMSVADFHMRIKRQHLVNSQFPKRIQLPNDQAITCPERWTK